MVAQALDGALPAYLVSLQEKAGGPLVEGGEALYAALQGDCHLHSTWSDGGAPIEAMAATAIAIGPQCDWWACISKRSVKVRRDAGSPMAFRY